MDDRIHELLSEAATVQAIAHYAGLPVEQTRRIYHAGIPWPLFPPHWQIQQEAIRENMNPVGYLAALAPVLHLELDEQERRLESLRAQDPNAIVEGHMAEHFDLVAARTGDSRESVRRVYGGLLSRVLDLLELADTVEENEQSSG